MAVSSISELEKNVLHYFGISFNVDENTLNRDTNIAADLGGTSMLMVGLISLIDNELDILIPLPEAGKFATIGDVIDRLVELGAIEQ